MPPGLFIPGHERDSTSHIVPIVRREGETAVGGGGRDIYDEMAGGNVIVWVI